MDDINERARIAWEMQVNESIDAIKERISNLECDTPDNAAFAELEKKVDALEQDMTSVKAREDCATSAWGGLDERIEALENEESAYSIHGVNEQVLATMRRVDELEKSEERTAEVAMQQMGRIAALEKSQPEEPECGECCEAWGEPSDDCEYCSRNRSYTDNFKPKKPERQCECSMCGERQDFSYIGQVCGCGRGRYVDTKQPERRCEDCGNCNADGTCNVDPRVYDVPSPQPGQKWTQKHARGAWWACGGSAKHFTPKQQPQEDCCAKRDYAIMDDGTHGAFVICMVCYKPAPNIQLDELVNLGWSEQDTMAMWDEHYSVPNGISQYINGNGEWCSVKHKDSLSGWGSLSNYRIILTDGKLPELDKKQGKIGGRPVTQRPAPPADADEGKDLTNTDAGLLWCMLDDIDTMSDQIKPTSLVGYKRFYEHAMRFVAKRFRVLSSDGYKIFKPKQHPADADGEKVLCKPLPRQHLGKGGWTWDSSLVELISNSVNVGQEDQASMEAVDAVLTHLSILGYVVATPAEEVE